MAMLKLLMPLGLLVLFAGWVVYQLFIKKDMKKHLGSLYLGITFLLKA
jgi:hypothetical protein